MNVSPDAVLTTLCWFPVQRGLEEAETQAVAVGAQALMGLAWAT